MNLIGFWGMDRQLHCRQYAFHNVSSNLKLIQVTLFYHKIFIVDHSWYATRQVDMRALFHDICLCFGQTGSRGQLENIISACHRIHQLADIHVANSMYNVFRYVEQVMR